ANIPQEKLVYRLPLESSLKVPEKKRGGPNFALCASDPDFASAKRKPYCLTFSIYQPFFQYPDWPFQGGTAAHGVQYTNPSLYALSKDGQTVVFGVVDPKLREHIGGENFAWKNVLPRAPNDISDPPVDKKYTTQITVADPVKTIVQLY